MKIINKLLSVNYQKGRGGQQPLLVVIHIIGKPGITAQSALNEFQNPNTEKSAHDIILRDGTIWNLVSANDTAFTNGIVDRPTNEIVIDYALKQHININEISYAIENEGSEDEDFTEAQYVSLAQRVKEICVRFSIPMDSKHIIRHSEIRKSKVCPGVQKNIARIIIEASRPSVLAPSQPASVSLPGWYSNFLARFWRNKYRMDQVLKLEK